MKIYVTNIPPSTIKLASIDKYILKKDGYKRHELVSKDFGTHVIEKDKMYRIEPTMNMDLHLINNFNGCNLLVDNTEYVHIPVLSQFPVDYILTKMTCFEYKINIKSNDLKLVVECLEETNELLEKEMVPVNFYFFANSFDNSFVNSFDNSFNKLKDNLLEEINVFLLELN
jgi:hypothetical protein